MSSSSGGSLPNRSAAAAVAAGLLSLATMPVAIAATRWSQAYALLDAAFAIPLTAALAVGVYGLLELVATE